MSPSSSSSSSSFSFSSPSSSSPSPLPSSLNHLQLTKPATRLASITAHMDASNPTVFTSDNVPQAPEDPLFGLMAAYRKDTFEKKVDLGIGAYRDNTAKPWILPVVKEVRGRAWSNCEPLIDHNTVRPMSAYGEIQTSTMNTCPLLVSRNLPLRLKS